MNLKNAIFGGSVTGISDRSGAYDGSIQAWLPIKDIVQGVVVTRDKRFVKILELLPVNFYTMSSMDKSAAIEDFAAYLKIAPANLQINVLTQPFDLDGYLKLLRGYLERETNEQCRLMLEESMDYVPQLVEREALTHRFFLSFSMEIPCNLTCFPLCWKGRDAAWRRKERENFHAKVYAKRREPSAGAGPLRLWRRESVAGAV